MCKMIQALQNANGELAISNEARNINLEKITTEMIVNVINELKADSDGSRDDNGIRYPLDAAIGIGVLALHNDDERHPTVWDKDSTYTSEELIDYGTILSLMVIDGLPVRIDFKASSKIKYVDGVTHNFIRNDSNEERELTVKRVKEYLKNMKATVENDILTVEYNGYEMYKVSRIK